MTKSVDDFKKDYLKQVGLRAQEEFYSDFEFMRVRCESPIEEVMLLAIMNSITIENPYELPTHFQRRNFVFGDPRPAPFDGAYIFLQANVNKFRADFLFDIWGGQNRQTLVVECDGHDFHERTKQQAKRDRSRDREMAELGITVLRYTGSEIWRDPDGCADQVLNMARKLMSYD